MSSFLLDNYFSYISSQHALNVSELPTCVVQGHDSSVEVKLPRDLGVPRDGDNRAGRPELGDETAGVAGRRQHDDGLGLRAVRGLHGGDGDCVGRVLVIELGLVKMMIGKNVK